MNLTYSSARDDFHKARRQAGLQEVVARLQGRDATLLSYEHVYRTLGLGGRSDRGTREIQVEAIAGSVGRYNEFTRTFLPRRETDERRWAGIMAIAVERGLDSLPPIEVYKIGETYFVQDGNHRVSVARQLGLSHIRARVVEIETRVPLAPDVQADELVAKAEYTEFLQRTRLDVLRPRADLSTTVPGGYAELEQQIEAYRQTLQERTGAGIERDEAAGRWYDQVYYPVAEAIRERALLEEFPGRTETDLYLWIDEHRADLQEALGLDIDSEVATADFAAGQRPRLQRALDALLPDDLTAGPAPGRWRQEKIADRYTGRLFSRLLVPLSGEEAGWAALEQALVIARLEGAQLLGLHVVETGRLKQSAEAQAVAAAFERRCAEAGVPGRLAVEVEDDGPARKISERALLADLVVLRLLHPPKAYRLGSGFRTVLQRSARPVLAVPLARPTLARAMLAFDGSARAREALFVATYLAEEHGTQLTVVTVADEQPAGEATLDAARQYLDLHSVAADYLIRSGQVEEQIAAAAQALDPDLVLMGGYGLHPMLEVVVGSAVDHMLRQERWPVLVCR